MKFLDKKEQVLDIQLTQYGKRLLSNGKFKPHSYAFFDDDIIYDTAWAGHNEDVPAWDIKMLDNQIESFAKTYKATSLELKIPQLEVLFNYDIKISVADTPPHEGTFEPMDQPIEGSMLSPDAPQFIFADGTYHYLEATNKELFARVLEQNKFTKLTRTKS